MMVNMTWRKKTPTWTCKEFKEGKCWLGERKAGMTCETSCIQSQEESHFAQGNRQTNKQSIN